jgi:hypothetical protein
MNKIELAEYVTKEFLHNEDRVVAVLRGEHPLEAIIVYRNGKRQIVTGKIAVDLLNAPDG